MSVLSARTWARVASAVALGVLVAGCSGSSAPAHSASAHSASARSSARSKAAAAKTASPSPSPAALDGSELDAALLPASAMPSGFSLDQSGERDTGSSTAPDSTQPVSASQACDLLDGTSWIDATGIVAGSFAQDDYVNGDRTEEIAQEADAYSLTDAEHAMSDLWELLGKCAHFTDTSGGTSAAITMTRSQPADASDQAFEAVQTSPAYEGGTTIVAVRVGDVIVTTLDSSSGSDKGSAALGYAERIAKNISKQS
jgi:hypothetical protein